MAVIATKAKVNELDHQFVMDCLKNYAAPRAKLSRWLAEGALIRKKMNYFFHREFQSIETRVSLTVSSLLFLFCMVEDTRKNSDRNKKCS